MREGKGPFDCGCGSLSATSAQDENDIDDKARLRRKYVSGAPPYGAAFLLAVGDGGHGVGLDVYGAGGGSGGKIRRGGFRRDFFHGGFCHTAERARAD
jgi:hypothetical protein